jgi:hypothetical protein
MLRGDPELIDWTVREAMALGKPGGGFIIGSSDSFRDGTPDENVRAYFEACQRYGSYAQRGSTPPGACFDARSRSPVASSDAPSSRTGGC